MIKIAFCDDEPSVLDELCALADRYRCEKNLPLETTAFHSPLDLLAEVERGAGYDILFLDILMPGETGMDAAAEIRRLDENVKIIFLTSSPEYAVQSYSVGAHYYQLKPICADSFFRLMDSAVAACKKAQTSGIVLRSKTGITRVELDRLEYCEVIHRTLFIHKTDGTVLECIGKLDDLSRQLADCGCFLRAHRSYLINLAHVHQLSYQAITMASQAQIPLPRGKYQEVKDAYLAFAFQNEQVLL